MTVNSATKNQGQLSNAAGSAMTPKAPSTGSQVWRAHHTSHSWGHLATPQVLCDIQPAQLNRMSLLCNHQVTLSATQGLKNLWDFHDSWFQPSIFCWWLWLQVLLTLLSEVDISYSVLSVDLMKVPLKPMEKFPLTLSWLDARKTALCCYFWLLSMLLHLL